MLFPSQSRSWQHINRAAKEEEERMSDDEYSET